MEQVLNTLSSNAAKQKAAKAMLEQSAMNVAGSVKETTLAGVGQILIEKKPLIVDFPRKEPETVEPVKKPAPTDPPPVLKDGAWFEIVVPSPGDPNAAQKQAEAEAQRKKMMMIGFFVLAGLILLVLLVKQFKKKKQPQA